MITLVKTHDGHDRIARHLMSDENDEVVTTTSGLVADDALAAVAELRLLATGARLKRPFVHITASPSKDYSDAEWQAYWAFVETEFDLEGAPYLEARHRKIGAGGRTAAHAHRVYLALTERHTGIDLSHSFLRSEKVSRLTEFATGERLNRGKHARAVVKALENEGRLEIAETMRSMGHLDGRRAAASTTPAERAQSDRRAGMAADEIAKRAWTAWNRSIDAGSFVMALSAFGLRLAQGDAHVRVLDQTGVHLDLRRKLNQMVRAETGSKVRKADIDRRLAGLSLEPLSVAMKSSAPLPPAAQQLKVTGRTRLKRERSPGRHSAGGGGPHPKKKEAAPFPAIEFARRREFSPMEKASIARFRQALAADVFDDVRELKERFERELAAQPLAKTVADDRVLAEAPLRPDIRPLIELDRRRRFLAEALTTPSIGRAGWRDEFKAELASVHARFGPLLQWVERRESEKTVHVLLKTRETIVQSSDHVTVDIASIQTAEIMIAYATRRGWGVVEIWGGDEAWREAAFRAAASAGITILSPDLHLPDASRADEVGMTI